MPRGFVKREPRDPSPTPSTQPATARSMAPPSISRPLADHDTQSTAPSFIRSHAPSAETRRRVGDDEPEPIFLEMRARPSASLNAGSQSPQNADASFSHQSFAHPTFSGIGIKLRAFNYTLGNLQRLGVSHVAELPELVLVGDQSAGKSSLMSGLARVNVPRSAGVGTRCPLHIRLIDSSNAHWSCTVALQVDYDFQPKGRIRKSDVTASNPFPPWVRKSHREIKIFKTIFDPGDIEEVLRWAQIAILNPGNDHELYIPGEGAIAKGTDLSEATAAAQFSPNIISLEIKGPELPGLSFYDLPGVFLSPDQEEDEYIVKVVHNLTRHYIKRERAIIMWALPMNADPENSISLGIIREAKAANRTIGIMTKADKLAPENESQWLAMFRGEKQSVGHGFFATSRPPHEPLESAGKWEELFFSHEVGSWPADFDNYKKRCGVDLLGEYISAQLGDAFARELPSIKTKVYHRLKEIQYQLAGLPELPSNVEHEVKKSLYQFLMRTKTVVKDSEFSSEWSSLNYQFRDIVFKIKPTCSVKEPSAQTIDLSDADTEASAITPSRRPRPSDSMVQQTPSKRQRPNNGPMVTPVKQESFTGNGSFRASSVVSSSAIEPQSPFVRFRNLGRLTMDIREIRSQVRKKQRPGMPLDLVPDEVRETMCLDAVKRWQGPLETYIDKTAELLERVTNQALEESLGNLRRRLIFKECQAYLKEFIDRIVGDQRGRLAEMYNSETYQMYMMNEDAFTRYKAQELEQLRRARAIYRLKAVALIEWSYEIKQPSEMSDDERVRENKILTTQLPKIGPDPYETEIEVAAFVRGYYITAATRFVEAVTMNVNSNLFRIMGGSDLDMFIDQKLGLYGKTDSHRYENLMEEDLNTARLREQLRGEMDMLSEAMSSINGLETSSGSGNGSGASPNGAIDLDDAMDDGILF